MHTRPATRDRIDTQSPQQAGPYLGGIPASPGRATGRTRFVRTLKDVGALRPQEVVLLDDFSVELTVACASAAAVIALRGGPLSSGATVARETGLPAVILDRRAAGLLSEGTLVTVDGGAGVVKICG